MNTGRLTDVARRARWPIFYIALGPALYLAWLGAAHVWGDHWQNHVAAAAGLGVDALHVRDISTSDERS